jgi:hypothetical protein
MSGKKGMRLTGRHARGVERPHVWIIGSDAGKFKHDMYHPWQLAKAQANFRHEDWTLEFEDYYQLWKDHWHNRGRSSENMCMTRNDIEGPWSADNVYLIQRKLHLQQKNQERRGNK